MPIQGRQKRKRFISLIKIHAIGRGKENRTSVKGGGGKLPFPGATLLPKKGKKVLAWGRRKRLATGPSACKRRKKKKKGALRPFLSRPLLVLRRGDLSSYPGKEGRKGERDRSNTSSSLHYAILTARKKEAKTDICAEEKKKGREEDGPARPLPPHRRGGGLRTSFSFGKERRRSCSGRLRHYPAEGRREATTKGGGGGEHGKIDAENSCLRSISLVHQLHYLRERREGGGGCFGHCLFCPSELVGGKGGPNSRSFASPPCQKRRRKRKGKKVEPAACPLGRAEKRRNASKHLPDLLLL